MNLFVNHASGYIEEKNGNKQLIFDDSVNGNKDLLKKYAGVWDGIKTKAIMVVKKLLRKRFHEN